MFSYEDDEEFHPEGTEDDGDFWVTLLLAATAIMVGLLIGLTLYP